jgi:hypothetical protein
VALPYVAATIGLRRETPSFDVLDFMTFDVGFLLPESRPTWDMIGYHEPWKQSVSSLGYNMPTVHVRLPIVCS